MENIKKFDIKSFLVGVLVMGGVMGGGFYYFYETNTKIPDGYISMDEYNKKIAEVSAYTPEIVYKEKSSPGLGGYFGDYDDKEIVPKMAFNDRFDKYEDLYNLAYYRVINKKYLISNGGPNGYLENQLELVFAGSLYSGGKYDKFYNKCDFENELKKYTDKRFTILNLGNFKQNGWIVDFDSKVTKDEMEKIKSEILKDLGIENDKRWPFIRIKYNSILIPKDFNDKGFSTEMGNNGHINY